MALLSSMSMALFEYVDGLVIEYVDAGMVQASGIITYS